MTTAVHLHLIALIALGLASYAQAEQDLDVEVWQHNILQADVDYFQATDAIFTSDFVFSFVNSRGKFGTGELRNYHVSEDQPLGNTVYELRSSSPGDFDVNSNHLAVSFDRENRIEVYKDFKSPIGVDLPGSDILKYFAGGIAIMPNSSLLVVWEYQALQLFPPPVSRSTKMLVYDFEGDVLVGIGAVDESDFLDDIDGATAPTGAFSPTNASLYYASDGSRNIHEIFISPSGTPSILRSRRYNEDTAVKDVVVSFSGKFLIVNYNLQIDVIDVATFESIQTIVAGNTSFSAVCWAPGDRYYAAITKLGDSIVMDWNSRQIVYNQTMPGKSGESSFCAWSPAGSFLLIDSVTSYESETIVAVQNVTTYLVNGYDLAAGVAYPSLPPRPGDTSVDVTIDEPEEKRACFPGSSLVETWDGERPISSLRVGDKVRVGPHRWSQIYLWGHREPEVVFEFRKFRFADSDQSLIVSPSHFVYREGRPVAAHAIKVNDFMSSGITGKPLKVVAVEKVVDVGLYNPHTVDGDLVVAGVHVSTYTSAFPPRLAHAFLLPSRLAFMLSKLNAVGSLLEYSIRSKLLYTAGEALSKMFD